MSDSGEQAYDYIVIGAGSAGCVLASRLTERSTNNVLLLEAGEDFPPGSEPEELNNNFVATSSGAKRFTWPGLSAAFLPRASNAPDERPRRRYNQGRLMGGGSSVNGMCANRGLPSDFNEWAERGAKGWDWDGVLPYYKKMETDTDFDGPLHGTDGPIKLRRLFEDQWPGYTKASIAAAASDGWEDLQDQNAVHKDGYFPIPMNNIDGKRISASTAYLTNDVRARPNFTLWAHTHVECLLFDGARVIGVRLKRDGKTSDIHAKEVVVSTGALHTPSLLMRSGIGPAGELSELGIEVVVDRAGVGKHLMEHPGVNFGAYLKRGARLTPGLPTHMIAALRYSSGHDGVPGGDMYIVPTNRSAWHAIGDRMGLMQLWVNKSYSTGEVTLNPDNIHGEPIVDFNMCSDPRDMERMINGVRFMANLCANPLFRDSVYEVFPVSYGDRARKVGVYSKWNTFQTWVGAQVMDASAFARKWIIENIIADGPSIDDLLADDKNIENWIRDTVLGHWHASCTCRMGAEDDPGAVTDPSGKVYGVDGLRICDASLMPMVPCANTNLTTLMIGEKIAATVMAG
ncbi:MAG: glucose dehydrogenase [Rhodospirillaceae bacterium]|nr:glucose dehydrogenase [Rhodospirillaceae bacterium]